MTELLADGAMTINAAATWSGLSRAKLYESMGRGEIPFLKVGKRRLIPKIGLRDFLTRHIVEQPTRDRNGAPVAVGDPIVWSEGEPDPDSEGETLACGFGVIEVIDDSGVYVTLVAAPIDCDFRKLTDPDDPLIGELLLFIDPEEVNPLIAWRDAKRGQTPQ